MSGRVMGSNASTTRKRKIFASGALLSLTLLTTGQAFAQQPRQLTEAEAAARRILINRAQTAAQTNNHQEALDNALRAGALQWSTTLREFTAKEYAALNRPAEALAMAEKCMQEASQAAATTSGRTQTQEQARVETCRNLGADQRTRVGFVEVSAPASLTELQVTVNGVVIEESLIRAGAPYVVNPGTVSLEATARGRQPYRWSGNIPIGSTQRITLDMQATNAGTPTTTQATLQLTVPSITGMRVTVNGTEVPASDLAAGHMSVPAGATTLDATAPGHSDFHWSGTVAAGASQPITIALAQIDSPPHTTPPAVSRGPSGAGIGLIVAGSVVTVAAGAMLGIAFAQNTSMCMIQPNGSGTVCADAPSKSNAETRNTMITAAIPTGIVGVGVLVTGVIVMATSSGGSAPRAMLLPDTMQGTGLGAQFITRF